MLGGMGRKGLFKERKDKALKDLGSRRQEGYRTVGGALVRGFTRFKEGDNDRGFPDGRDVGRLEGKVVW